VSSGSHVFSILRRLRGDQALDLDLDVPPLREVEEGADVRDDLLEDAAAAQHRVEPGRDGIEAQPDAAQRRGEQVAADGLVKQRDVGRDRAPGE